MILPRLRRTARRAALGFSGILALVSGAAAIVPGVPWWTWVAVVVVATSVTGLVFWHYARPEQVPVEEVLEPEDGPDGDVVLEVAPAHDLLVTANLHAKELYGRDALSLPEVERWTGRNPFILGILRGGHGQYLGYFDILPLTSRGETLLMSGHVEERDIIPEMILPPDRMRDAKVLYLSGIAVRDCGTPVGKVRFAKMCGALVSYLVTLYGPGTHRIVALAATREGEAVLRKANGKLVCSAHARKNEHDLYEVVLTPERRSLFQQRASLRAKPARLVFRVEPSHLTLD